MKKLLIIPLFICITAQLNAQNRTTDRTRTTDQNRTVTISGKVLDDATKQGIELAGLRLMNAKDSSYVTGAATDKDGKFSLSAKSARYILQVTFLGYTTLNIDVDARRNVALGDLVMKEDGILLGEAVVTGQAPEIVVKGDTIEYNADSYRVQESAVLEDLIKKIPGAEIGENGKITINGKDISKILVDGKEFFSDDPKTASQNLPAKIVEKLQVLDKKSDLAQLTGFDDGEEETVINLVVKPGMKEGIMSNVLVGAGNKDRYEGNGFINYAKENTRITLLGNVNNTNNENADVRTSDSGGVLASKEVGFNIASEPSEKLKYDADVYYSHTNNDLMQTSDKQWANNRHEYTEADRTTKNDNLRFRGRMEWAPDSLTKVIFRPRATYSTNDVFRTENTSFTNLNNSLEDYISDENSSSRGKSFNINGSLLFNRKLNNRGRSFSVEMSGGNSNGNTDGDNYVYTDYINKADSIQDQISSQDNDSYNWRVRVSYLEPIWMNADKTRLNLIEVAYNIRGNHSETDKKTFDFDNITNDYTGVFATGTRNTVNDFLNQNASVSFQSRSPKFNYTIGVGLEPSRMKTVIQEHGKDDKIIGPKNYLNFSPRFEFNYLWDRRHNLRIRYNGQAEAPSTNQLFDGVFSQNGNNLTIGNPNLRPNFTHSFNLRYQKYIPEKASSIMMFARFNFITDDIVSTFSWNDAGGRITTYDNIDGNMNGFFRLMYNTPLRNKKFSINTSTFGNYTRDNTYIVDDKSKISEKNTANVFRIGENLRLKFNSDIFQFNVGANVSFENAKHSIQKDQNRKTYDYGGFGDFTWYLPFDFALESDLRYSANSGYEGAYQQNSWIWNASLSKQLLKAKNATIRIKVYDILQERVSISQSSNSSSSTFTSKNTIGSYFMVNFIYRFNSFKGGMKSSDMEPERRGPGPGGPPPGGGRRSFGGGGRM